MTNDKEGLKIVESHRDYHPQDVGHSYIDNSGQGNVIDADSTDVEPESDSEDNSSNEEQV